MGIESPHLVVEQDSQLIDFLVGEVVAQLVERELPEIVLGGWNQGVGNAEIRARPDLKLFVVELPCDMREHQFVRLVVGEVGRVAVYQPAADIDLLEIGGDAIAILDRLHLALRPAVRCRITVDHLIEDPVSRNVGEVYVGFVALGSQRAEVENRRFHRVRRHRRFDPQSFDVVPGVRVEIDGVEEGGKFLLLN